VSVARTLGLTAALLAMLAAGLWVGGHPATMPAPLRDLFVDEAGGLSAEASELIEDNYYRSVKQGELIDSSLNGMVRGLRRRHRDRFSEYFSPTMLTRFNESIEGRFSGIGLSVTGTKRGLRVVQVFKRSPAERAGIEVGDTIVTSGSQAGDRFPSIFPRDLLIGKVASVGQSETDIFKTIQVEPLVDLSALRSVLVLVPKKRGGAE